MDGITCDSTSPTTGGGGSGSGNDDSCSGPGSSPGGGSYSWGSGHEVACPQDSYETGNIYIYPDPSNCSHYIECTCGFPYGMSCPSGLYFCPEKSTCTWIWETGCTFNCQVL
ncbi:MAG: chitin binding domain-containing protein [Elusimicrobiota bacterium]|nr:chitin binding domain-containing protein [Elusimicrobiota bacterium]